MRVQRTLIGTLTTATAAVAIGLGVAAPAAADVPDGSELVSVGAHGGPIADGVAGGHVSDDGNRIAFVVPGDEATPHRVYLRDRAAGKTTLVHESSIGEIALGSVDLSGNGRFLAVSEHNFDENEAPLIVLDLADGSVEKVTDKSMSGLSLSDNGRKIAYGAGDADASGPTVFVTNLDTGKTTRMTNPASPARNPVLSGDGAKVAYLQYGHVYSRIVATGALTRVDVRPDGTFGPKGHPSPRAFSDTGKFLLFSSSSTQLAAGTGACDDDEDSSCLFRRNFTEAKTTVASVLPDGTVAQAESGRGDMSGDGRVVAFQSLPWNSQDIYVRVLSTATTRLASVNAAGEPANESSTDASLSNDGGLVAYTSKSNNLGHPEVTAEQVWIARGK